MIYTEIDNLEKQLRGLHVTNIFYQLTLKFETSNVFISNLMHKLLFNNIFVRFQNASLSPNNPKRGFYKMKNN